MELVCIADTQSLEYSIPLDQLPSGDMIIIAGDLTNGGSIYELERYNKWLETLNYKHKLIIAGNHDTELGHDKTLGKKIFTNAIYLQNEGIEIEGLKIWGSPVNETNIRGDWAFADNLKEQIDLIPKNLDILITHGGCYGILDKLHHGMNVGCVLLRDKVAEVKPKYQIFGHIHESYGRYYNQDTEFLNVAMTDEWNNLLNKGKLIHQPVIIEL